MNIVKSPRRRRPIHTEADLDHVGAKPKSKKKALLVGISYNKGLKGPHKDVNVMRSLLIEKYNYHPDDIIVLVDDHDDKRKHFQPTRANLLRELKNLIEDAKRGDQFFFHYAGHVIQGEEDPNSPEEDGREEYIVPSDAVPYDASHSDALDRTLLKDCIQDDKLKELLVNRLPVGARLVAVFDSCHSQSLLDLEHFRCNRVYVPWISKGRRKSDSMWNNVQRKQAIVRARTIYQTKRLTDGKVKSRKTSVDQLQVNTDVNSNSNFSKNTNVTSSSLTSSQSSTRPYTPPMMLMSPTRSIPLTPIITNSSSTPTVLDTPTTLSPGPTIKAANTVSFSTTPLQKLKQRASLTGWGRSITNGRNSRSPSPTPKSIMTTTKKRESLSTMNNAFIPWFQEDPLLEYPEKLEAEPEPYIVESPVQEYCSGDCRCQLEKAIEEMNARGHGHHGHDKCEGEDSQGAGEGEVISLSSCRDSQLAWEAADGTSMTQILVKQLRKQTHPSMKDLMTNLSHELHKAAVDMHTQTKAYKKLCVNYRRKRNKPKTRGSDLAGLEMNNFQNPELSSRKPLDMERIWNM